MLRCFLQVSGIDKEHKGKCIVYLKKILETQKWASYAEGYLTDTGDLEIWTCKRTSAGYVFHVKTNLSLQNRGDLLSHLARIVA